MLASLSFLHFGFLGLIPMGITATAGCVHLKRRRALDILRDTASEPACDDHDHRFLTENSADVLMRVDYDLRSTYASSASLRTLGFMPEEIVGRAIDQYVYSADRETLITLLTRARDKGQNTDVTFRVHTKTSDVLWIEARCTYVAEDGGFVIVLRDISKRKTAELALRVANAELTRLAGSDSLTGLANRRKLDQTLDGECRRAARNATPISLLLLDVDRFKAFNDRYGHQAGDLCLKRIAAAIRAAVERPSDMAARYGGEEFALLVPGTEQAGAAQLAERARKAVEDLGIPHEGNLDCGGVVTISVGFTTVTPRPETLAGVGTLLVAEADRALYEAKRLGRNRVMRASDVAIVSSSWLDEERLGMLATYRTDGVTERSESLDRIARMAAVLLGMPGAFIALVGRDDIDLIGCYGLEEEIESVSHGLCAPAIGGRTPTVVQDAMADPRFRESIEDTGIRSLAIAPMVAPESPHQLGLLCVMDRSVRPPLDEAKRMLLGRLADLAAEDLDARRPRRPTSANKAA